MRASTILRATVPLFAIALTIFLIGCSTDNPVQPSNQTHFRLGYLAGARSTHGAFLEGEGYAGKTITAAGGLVGGRETFGNTVEVPAGALSSDTFIGIQTVENGFAMEFSPSMQFNAPVAVTLSYKGTGVDPSTIKCLWFDPASGEWTNICSNPVINYSRQTVSFYVTHFSRYAWGDG
jgi:hypothetical protein